MERPSGGSKSTCKRLFFDFDFLALYNFLRRGDDGSNPYVRMYLRTSVTGTPREREREREMMLMSCYTGKRLIAKCYAVCRIAQHPHLYA